jgi:hypothetical protein
VGCGAAQLEQNQSNRQWQPLQRYRTQRVHPSVPVWLCPYFFFFFAAFFFAVFFAFFAFIVSSFLSREAARIVSGHCQCENFSENLQTYFSADGYRRFR